jgi:hypothetical protein
VTLLAAVEAQLKALKKSPRATLIQARIAPIETGLAAARAKDRPCRHGGAVALRAANDAVSAAKRPTASAKVRQARRRDRQARREGGRRHREGGARHPGDRRQKDADALKFDDFGKGLDQIEVRLDRPRPRP